jgi:regulatory protein
MTEVLPKRAKLRAMNLLKSRSYTTSQLRMKLQQGGYPETVIEEALEYVASFHYTDDLCYAVDFITENEQRKSRFRIELDLRAKGLSTEIIEQAWREWQDNGGSQNEKAMIEALLKKRNYDPERADIKEKQKTYAFLMRKGFSGEKISRAMREDF